MNSGKRSADRGIEAFGSDQVPEQLPLSSDWWPGVGGRQPDPPPRRRGGGYQHGCSFPRRAVGARSAGAADDPRIEELRRVGIGRAWLRVAQAIGFEAFLAAWQVLASDESILDDRSRVLVPSPTRYSRYQRNLLIRQLHEQGLDPRAIVQNIRRTLNEQITESHVQRLLRQIRV